MCCLLSALVLIGPRGLVFLLWLFQPIRFTVFDGFLLPLLGFLFLPWTMLVYLFVAPGGIETPEAIALGLGVALDLGSYAAGGVTGRRRA